LLTAMLGALAAQAFLSQLVTKEANSPIWMIDMFKRQQKLRRVCHRDTMQR